MRSSRRSSCSQLSNCNAADRTSAVVAAAADSEPLLAAAANLSFSGCGFLGIYHVGVASCCKVYAPHLFAEKIAGASAGALVACALIIDADLGEATTFTLNLALQARSRALGPLSPSFQLVKYLRRAMDKFLPDNAHVIASGRLHISLTRVSDRKNILVSQFNSKEDLLDALICSTFVPLYSGILPPKFRGVHFVDGGLTDNLPVLNEATITVSPFAGESDICPSDDSYNLHHAYLAGSSIQLTTSNLYRLSIALFPPTPEVLSNMCRQGFDDTLRYLQKNKLISCAHHLSIQSAIISSSPVKFRIPGTESESFCVAPAVESDPAFVSMDTDSSCDDVSPSDTDMYADGSESDSSDCISDCDECDRRERFALQDSPPVMVQTALQAACDEVNRGFMAQVYKSKAYQVLSLMATPYVLPFEIGFNLARKLYDWAPYMSEDMQWFIKGLYALMRDLLLSMQTEGLDASDAAMERGRVLREWGFTWEMRWGVHLQTTTTTPSRHPSVGKRPSRTSATAALPAAASALNVNMGISVDYGASSSGLDDSPLHCVHEARRQVLSNPKHHHHALEMPSRRRSSGRGAAVSALSPPVATVAPQVHTKTVTFQQESTSLRIAAMATTSYPLPGEESSLACDSFDDCLQAAERMDAALAYFYADEKSAGSVKVVEIFPLPPCHHHQHPTSPGASALSPPSRASVIHSAPSPISSPPPAPIIRLPEGREHRVKWS